jgi:hypothetical protein
MKPPGIIRLDNFTSQSIGGYNSVGLALMLLCLLFGVGLRDAHGTDVNFEHRPSVLLKWNTLAGQHYAVDSMERNGIWKSNYIELREKGNEDGIYIAPSNSMRFFQVRTIPSSITTIAAIPQLVQFDGASFQFSSNSLTVSKVRASGLGVSLNDAIEMHFERFSDSSSFDLISYQVQPKTGVARGAYFVGGDTNRIPVEFHKGGVEDDRYTFLFEDPPPQMRLRAGQALVVSFEPSYEASLEIISPSGRTIAEFIDVDPTRIIVTPIYGIDEEGDYLIKGKRKSGTDGTYTLGIKNANSRPLEKIEDGSKIKVEFASDFLHEYAKFQVLLDAGAVCKFIEPFAQGMSITVLDDNSSSVSVDTTSGAAFVTDRPGNYYIFLEHSNRGNGLVYESMVSIALLGRR